MTPETLTAWKPRRHGRAWTSNDADAVPTSVPATDNGAGHVILVKLEDDIPQCDQVALLRAAELNGLDDRLFHPNRKLDGEAWYDRLARIVHTTIEHTTPAEETTLYPQRMDDITENMQRVDAITVKATLEQEGVERGIELKSDLAVTCTLPEAPTAGGVLITRNTTLTMETLQKLLHWAMFEPRNDEHEDDSPETQEDDFLQNAHYAAAKLLLAPEEAAREIVRYAVEHRVVRFLPADRTIEIRRSAGSDRVDVQIR